MAKSCFPSTVARGIGLPVPVRILVVDDFEPWRCMVSSVLAKHHELQVIGQVADGAEAVKKALELRPDLILMDVRLPKLNGIEAAAQIRESVPGANVLFVTVTDDADVAMLALSKGAKGYILKQDAGRELLAAIKTIVGGNRFISGQVTNEAGKAEVPS